MKRVVWGAAILSLTAASMGSAQTRTLVRGRIVDQAGQPLAGAEVLLEYLGSTPRTLTTTSNEKGEYVQVGLRPGPYRITFQLEGYTGGTIDRRVSGQTQLPEYRMLPLIAPPPPPPPAPVDETRATAKQAFGRGIDLTRAGSYDEALRAFEEVIELSPDLAEAHYNKGFIFIQRQDWQAAESSLEKAIELDADYADAKLALSKLYQDTGRASEALALMNAAAGDESVDARVHFNRGVFNLNAGNTTEALVAFRRAEELDPGMPEVQFHLGTLAVGQGKIDEAVERLERYLSTSPEAGQDKATAEGLLQALKK